MADDDFDDFPDRLFALLRVTVIDRGAVGSISWWRVDTTEGRRILLCPSYRLDLRLAPPNCVPEKCNDLWPFFSEGRWI